MKHHLILLIITLNSILGYSQLNQKQDIVILKKMTLENITHSLKSQTKNGTYLTGITFDIGSTGESMAYVFKNFAGSWELKDKLPFLNSFEKIDDFTNDENLIYFGSHLQGGSSGNGSYYFNVFSIEENKFFSVEYYWSDYKYSYYEFINIDTIKNKRVLAYIEEKASKSEYVYKPSNKLTLEESWKIDNKNIYEKIFKEQSQIIFQYTENLTFEFEKITAENKDYKVYNQFKGNLYGYNKKLKKYFIIWVPNWFYDTTIFMFLNNDNILGIQDSTLGSNGSKIYIDLDNKEINGSYKGVEED